MTGEKTELVGKYLDNFSSSIKTNFREFFFHKKRNSLNRVFRNMCQDLKEISTLDSLYNSYTKDEFFLHLDLIKYSLRTRTLIEDSAYYIRLQEINDSNNYSELEWKDIYEVLLK